MSDDEGARGEAGLADVDALVIGAGPAGCAAAIALGEAGWRVALVTREGADHERREGADHERREGADRERPGESLSPAGPGLLTRLGVLSEFLSDEHRVCHANVSVWGGSTPRWYDLLRDPRGPGYHVDRARFEARLRARALGLGARLRAGRVREARREDGAWVFPGLDGLRARRVIDASGRAAVFARARGVAREVAWEQVALVAFPAVSRPVEEGFTLVEAVEAGFWYSAPLPGRRFALALFTLAELHRGRGAPPILPHSVHSVGEVPKAEGVSRLESRLARVPRRPSGGRLSRLLADAPHTRARLEAHGARLDGRERFVEAGSARLRVPASEAEGWIAVGDAAMSYDPVSAHGLTLALRTGIDAAEVLLGEAAGEVGGYARYAARLKAAFEAQRAEALRIFAREQRWPEAPYWRSRHRWSSG